MYTTTADNNVKGVFSNFTYEAIHIINNGVYHVLLTFNIHLQIIYIFSMSCYKLTE
jgi:hypothetical protein